MNSRAVNIALSPSTRVELKSERKVLWRKWYQGLYFIASFRNQLDKYAYLINLDSNSKNNYIQIIGSNCRCKVSSEGRCKCKISLNPFPHRAQLLYAVHPFVCCCALLRNIIINTSSDKPLTWQLYSHTKIGVYFLIPFIYPWYIGCPYLTGNTCTSPIQAQQVNVICRFWRWYINITISILDIIHRPAFYFKLNSTPQDSSYLTGNIYMSLLRAQQVNDIYRFVTMM
jgi:hypothetical protein